MSTLQRFGIAFEYYISYTTLYGLWVLLSIIPAVVYTLPVEHPLWCKIGTASLFIAITSNFFLPKRVIISETLNVLFFLSSFSFIIISGIMAIEKQGTWQGSCLALILAVYFFIGFFNQVKRA